MRGSGEGPHTWCLPLTRYRQFGPLSAFSLNFDLHISLAITRSVLSARQVHCLLYGEPSLDLEISREMVIIFDTNWASPWSRPKTYPVPALVTLDMPTRSAMPGPSLVGIRTYTCFCRHGIWLRCLSYGSEGSNVKRTLWSSFFRGSFKPLVITFISRHFCERGYFWYSRALKKVSEKKVCLKNQSRFVFCLIPKWTPKPGHLAYPGLRHQERNWNKRGRNRPLIFIINAQPVTSSVPVASSIHNFKLMRWVCRPLISANKRAWHWK